jgi:hypothetical protein
MNQSIFCLIKQTTRDKIKNIEQIPSFQKRALLETVEHVTCLEDFIMINDTIKNLIRLEGIRRARRFQFNQESV